MSLENCTCSPATGCGDYDEAGCPACRDSDVYLPCPLFGFMCWPPIIPGVICDCCTAEQQEMTRRYHESPSSRSDSAPRGESAGPGPSSTDVCGSGPASNVPS